MYLIDFFLCELDLPAYLMKGASRGGIVKFWIVKGLLGMISSRSRVRSLRRAAKVT